MNSVSDREGGNMEEEICDRCMARTLAELNSKQTRGVEMYYSCRAQRRYVLQNLEFSFKTILSVILLTLLLSPVDVDCRAGAYKSAENFYAQRGDQMVSYLAEFGYLWDASAEAGPAGLTSKEAYVQAIKNLQKMGNIPETGVVDRRTVELMQRPRCGVKDVQKPAPLTRHRRKRYVTAPSKWETNDLTYKILNITPDLSSDKIRRIISSAFKVWSDVSPLTFSETLNSDAHILIQFARGYHHDGYPFDGKGSVLAHAFFPGDDRGGDTHFDDDETWTFNSTEGVDLFMVAAHEFGHALGLAHSSNTEALMYPWYQGYVDGFKLPYDDVAGIQSLYGSKRDGRLPPRPEPTRRPPIIPDERDRDRDRDRDRGRDDGYTVNPTQRPSNPDDDVNPCLHSIDAITVIRKEVFIFIGSKFWRLGSNGISSSPTKINQFWYDLPEDGVDALYEREDGKIVFFKGNRFWMFASNHMVSNFPKEGRRLTELGIDKEVKKIDAVFVWAYNKRTYLVTGDMYWKLNSKDDYIEYDYPRDMSIWRNVPVPLDSAFQHWDGKTYFLQGDQFWEFYDNKMRTRKKTGKPIAKLLGCRNGKLSNVMALVKDEDSSGTSVQIIVSNLVILLMCIHVL